MYSENLLNHKCGLILGYTTRRHLLLDLDNTGPEKAEKLAKTIMKEYPKVGDCLIVESSNTQLKQTWAYFPNRSPICITKRSSMHLIFNNEIGLNSCTKICNTLSGLNILNHGYEDIRKFRGDMTLRVSHAVTTEGVKPAPKPVKYLKNPHSEKNGKGIITYIKTLRIGLCLFFTDFNTEYKTDNSSYRTDYNAKVLSIYSAKEGCGFDG